MASRLGPRVRYRHQQPHSAGPQPGRFSLHQPGESKTAPEIERILRERLSAAFKRSSSQLGYVNVNELEGIDRQFLVERQLISREHAESQGARGVAIDSRSRSA